MTTVVSAPPCDLLVDMLRKELDKVGNAADDEKVIQGKMSTYRFAATTAVVRNAAPMMASLMNSKVVSGTSIVKASRLSREDSIVVSVVAPSTPENDSRLRPRPPAPMGKVWDTWTELLPSPRLEEREQYYGRALQ